MTNINYRKKNIFFTFVTCLFIINACGQSPPPETPTPEVVSLNTKLLLDNIEGSLLNDCTLAVIVNVFGENFRLNVTVQAEAGILFKNSPSIIPSADRRRALIENLDMRASESRQLLFPCEVDTNTTMPGEYVIETAVYTPQYGGSIVTLAEESIKAFISVQDEDGPQFLSSQEAFDELFQGSYIIRNTNLSALIKLDEIEQPSKGIIMVKVPSNKNGYTPQVIISVLGGALFKDTPFVNVDPSKRYATGTPGQIAELGSRILTFPFELDSSSFDGIYTIELLLRSEEYEVKELLPVAIKVSSSTAKSSRSWLSSQEISLPDPTATSETP